MLVEVSDRPGLGLIVEERVCWMTSDPDWKMVGWKFLKTLNNLTAVYEGLTAQKPYIGIKGKLIWSV